MSPLNNNIEVSNGTAQAGTLEQIKSALKNKMEVFSQVGEDLKKLKDDFGNLDNAERFKRIGGILAVAFLGLFMDKKQMEEYRKERDDIRVTEVKPVLQESDTSIFNEIPKHLQPLCRKTKDIKIILADHQHNTKLLELLPSKERNLRKLIEKYEVNKKRYETVAKAVHLPAMLIAAIHFKEANMDFSRYLHNGQPLGRETTIVPKGILFQKEEWEKAAIHALGGDVVDNKGQKSLKSFHQLKTQLGMDENTTEMAPMLAFAERYNGLGYRNKGLRSTYVYAGTNLMSRGRYVADFKFDKNALSENVGIAGFIMGVQAKESNQKIRIASTDTIWDEDADRNKIKVS